jgi:GH15 family glucan-1,4-alpha-glucosidase
VAASRVLAAPAGRAAGRVGGYAPIRDYAAIGDGRTVALVARDGSVDWLCLPNLDSPSVFGALLDAHRGGSFSLAPTEPFEVERRYLDETNVLETTFRTASGAVRVTDALTRPGGELPPARELLRHIEGLAGDVRLRWRVDPRFRYGQARRRLEQRGSLHVASSGSDALAVISFDAGEGRVSEDGITGHLDCRQGERGLLVLASAHGEPLVYPTRDDAERRLAETAAAWRSWSSGCRYEGPWRDMIIRSGLALKLLVFAPTGAIAAAPTTSLPEELGGERNWDYRYAWVRDAAFTLGALLELGSTAEAESLFWWLLHASQRTAPDVRALYQLDGGECPAEIELPLDGYRGSRPVRAGNAAADQLQLGIYGDLLDTAAQYVDGGGRIDPQTGRRLARIADLACERWRLPDRGIWEVRSEPVHTTHSKVMCWVALSRALRLAPDTIPGRHAERWRTEAAAIQHFVTDHCWSERRRSYVRFAGADELDAALLLAGVEGFFAADDRRLADTVDAIRRELADGPLVYRYRGEDGVAGGEGAFVACSFWLVQGLTHLGRLDEAAELLEELFALANDVGLYAEEIDPGSLEFLGNMPQGLSHLALVNAALGLGRASA